MLTFLDYRCSNSNDRAFQVVHLLCNDRFKDMYQCIVNHLKSPYLVQLVTGPRITPVKSKLDQSKSNDPSDLVQGLVLSNFIFFL